MPTTSPVLQVEIDFASGPSFAYPVILDDPYSLLDSAVLGLTTQDIVDISTSVLRVNTRRGRNRLLSTFEAGFATVVINDPNADFSPSNTSSPYYGKLLPLRKIRISANVDRGALGIINYIVFSGYITSYDTSFYEGTNETSTVTLQCVDAFRLLANVATETTPVPGCTAGQLSGARINALLDYAEWPSSMRAIDSGQSSMQVDPGGVRTILAACQTIEQSEFGGFFIDLRGNAKFYDRDKISILADTTPRRYSDDGVYYNYSSLDFAYDDQLIINDMTVTRVGGTPQEWTDQDSIDTYFIKSATRTGLLIETDAESLDQAQTIIASRKDATQRIDSMTLSLLGSDDTRIATTLTLDIYSLVNISKTMPGGSVVETELFCQGVAHNVSPGNWTTQIYTAEPIIQAFILNSETQGVLDINALTY